MNIQQEKEECAFVAAAFFSCSSLFLLKFITKLLQGLQRCRELKIVSLFFLGCIFSAQKCDKTECKTDRKKRSCSTCQIIIWSETFLIFETAAIFTWITVVVFCSQNDQMQIDLDVDANGMPLISEFRCYLISLPAGSFLCGKICHTKWAEVQKQHQQPHTNQWYKLCALSTMNHFPNDWLNTIECLCLADYVTLRQN